MLRYEIFLLFPLVSTVKWTEDNVCDFGMWRPMMTFAIKKKPNTELFIDRMAALYKGESWIRDRANEMINKWY